MRRSSMKNILCFLMLAMPTAALAQQPGQASDHQLILQLLSRIEELESEVRQMKQAAPAGTPTESSARVGTPTESSARAGTPTESSARAGTPTESSARAGTPTESSARAGTPTESSARA